jgi:hypothetical protein
MGSILLFDFERSKYCEHCTCIPATKIKLLYLSEIVRYAHQNFGPNSEDLKLSPMQNLMTAQIIDYMYECVYI